MDYPALQAAIAGALNRGDLYGMIGTFVALAEAQAGRDLRHWRMIARATTNVAVEVEAAPDDFLELISVSLAGPDAVLDGLSPDALAARKGRESVTRGRPDSYALVGGALQFFPAPDSGYDVIISYYQQVPALSAAAPTNWLLSAFPDLYLYAALGHAGAYLAPDARLAVWKGLYDEALESARQDGVRSLHGARPTPQVSNVV